MKKPSWKKYNDPRIYEIECKTNNDEMIKNAPYVYNKYDSYGVDNSKSESYTNKINKHINYADSAGKKEQSENDYNDMRIVNNALNWGKRNRSASYVDEDQQRSCTDDRTNV